MLLVSSGSFLYPIRWSQMLSWEWRCSCLLVGAAPTGDAPTTTEWSTIYLPTKVRFILETWRYVAFLGELAPGTRHPHHDGELTSCYHDTFLPWDLYHNNIVLFNHDSPITRSHFMDPTDRAIKGFYCTRIGCRIVVVLTGSRSHGSMQ